MGEDSPGNGRITNAVLKRDVEHIIDKLDKLEERLEDWGKRVSNLEIVQGAQHVRVNSLAAESDKLARRTVFYDGINGIGVIVGTIIGFFFGPRA